MSIMQLAYFPYLMLGDVEEIIYGNVKVWNFKKKAAEYIPDETLRNKVKALLSTNKYGNSVIEDMGILSIGDIDFRQATDADLAIAKEIRLILFLSWIAQNNVRLHDANAGHFIATSENFELAYQDFQLESDNISESTGYIVTHQIWGYKIGETSFIAPSHVLRPLSVSFDADLRATLMSLKVIDRALYNRILRATDLLFESYYNNPNVSLNARILLQVGALEVLLDLPTEGQRKRLKNDIESMTVLPSDPVEAYPFEIRPGVTQTETRSIKVKWADRFYTLRNHIIHGDEVPVPEFLFERQRHTDIAAMFFVLLTKMLLNDRLGETIFYDKIIWASFKDRNEVEREGFVYDNGLLEKIKAALHSS